MRLIKIGSCLLILLVAFATAEIVDKPTDASVDVSENNTEIPGVTESVSKVPSNESKPVIKTLNEEIKGRARSETTGEIEEVVKLEREALLEKRSIGNIARLLLGGNVPPNHPLVKNPEPKTFNLASNIVASVPGREYGGSGWNTGGGWNSNALSQLSTLLSTKQRLIPHLSQVTSGVTGLAGIKGELFKQIQTISAAAIAQAAADAAAKAVTASAAAQAITNTVANAVHQTPSAVENSIKHANNNLLQGWYSNQQNTYVAPGAAQAASNNNNNILTPFSQASQINNQYRQATPLQPQNSYHSSYTQYQQQQQQQLQNQPQQAPNTLYNQPQNNFNNNNNNNYNTLPSNNNFNNNNNNYNTPSNNYNSPATNNFNSGSSYNSPSLPLIANPNNNLQNQAPGSTGVPGNAVPQSNYNSQSQANSAPFNSAGNSFGSTAHTNNAPQYSPAPSGNSYNNQQFSSPAQNYGGYNNNNFNNGGPNNNFNNYNRNAPVGGAGSGPGYVSGQHSQPAGSHAYPQNGQSYSGPPSGNFNSPSGISGGYPNTHYHPSSSSSGNQYPPGNNGPQNFHNPGPPYNSPETHSYSGPPPPFNAPPSSSYSSGGPQSGPNNFGPHYGQGPANNFGGYGNSNLNRPYNYDASASNNNQINYNANNNYNNRNNNNNDNNRFNNNGNNYNSNNPTPHDNNRNNNGNGNNNNNNFNRNSFDSNNFNRDNNNDNFQGHSRFQNGPSSSRQQNQSSRKGGEPNKFYTTRHDEDGEPEESVDKREWSSNSHKHDDEDISSDVNSSPHYDSIREDRHERVKPLYKESYNPHKHRWTEHPPRRGQVDDRPNFAAHPKSKLGASRRAHNGHRRRNRVREGLGQPTEVYTTLPEYVFRNDRPHRSANQTALLAPVSFDEDIILPPSSSQDTINVSPPQLELESDPSSYSGSGSGPGVIVGSGSLPATLTINLPTSEHSKIIPAITVFETSFISS